MGCVTGFVAKIFLLAFNAAVALVGLAVLSLAAVVSTTLASYALVVPAKTDQILIGLQSVAGFIIVLGAFGVLVACCCNNKLFLYPYFLVGVGLVVAILTFAIMGETGLEKTDTEIRVMMRQEMVDYDFQGTNTAADALYHDNKCCGVDNFKDWKEFNQVSLNKIDVAYGCCMEMTPNCNKRISMSNPQNIYVDGCYQTLMGDVRDLAATTMRIGIFFGVLLFGLLTSTCLCLKCTDIMPI